MPLSPTCVPSVMYVILSQPSTGRSPRCPEIIAWQLSQQEVGPPASGRHRVPRSSSSHSELTRPRPRHLVLVFVFARTHRAHCPHYCCHLPLASERHLWAPKYLRTSIPHTESATGPVVFLNQIPFPYRAVESAIRCIWPTSLAIRILASPRHRHCLCPSHPHVQPHPHAPPHLPDHGNAFCACACACAYQRHCPRCDTPPPPGPAQHETIRPRLPSR
jgi:hypothetical protein